MWQNVFIVMHMTLLNKISYIGVLNFSYTASPSSGFELYIYFFIFKQELQSGLLFVYATCLPSHTLFWLTEEQ